MCPLWFLPLCLPHLQGAGRREGWIQPRGRIYLMKEQLEGSLGLDSIPCVDLVPSVAAVACVTACPSGVEYGELLAPFRARAPNAVAPWKSALPDFSSPRDIALSRPLPRCRHHGQAGKTLPVTFTTKHACNARSLAGNFPAHV